MLKQIVNFVFIYLIVWWTVIFCVLPFSAGKDDNHTKGNDRGAPKNPRLKRTFFITSIAALIITASYLIAINTGIIDLKAIGEADF